jgi:hypothetical protein
MPAHSPTNEAMTSSESSAEPKSRSAIGPESRRPAASPAVAVPIVNQNDVRSTLRLCSGSGESK